ncbi:hypothetical protein ACFRCI_09455 [Streptomyces sp. NPDC056638]|uniref:hypothetical protein n=1 Tax=Streptomyces sp. NPDC056638 TaxID=3345887 RepID=UPI0036B08EC3
MTIWPGWRLFVRLQRSTPKRCSFALKTAGDPMRCIFTAGHPAHGHTLTSDLPAAPVASPGLLADRR